MNEEKRGQIYENEEHYCTGTGRLSGSICYRLRRLGKHGNDGSNNGSGYCSSRYDSGC